MHILPTTGPNVQRIVQNIGNMHILRQTWENRKKGSQNLSLFSKYGKFANISVNESNTTSMAADIEEYIGKFNLDKYNNSTCIQQANAL